MTEPSAMELQRRLRGLQEEYLQQLPAKIRSLVVAWSSLKDQQWERPLLESVYRLVHGVAGSATTFGLAQVSEAAKELEALLALARVDDFTPDQQYFEDVQSSVLKLVNASQRARATALKVVAPPDAPAVSESANEVYVVEGDDHVASVVVAQLGYFGYEVRRFERFGGVEQALRERRPVALVMGIELPDGNGAELLTALDVGLVSGVAVVFISSRDDFATRLAAVRAGGAAYLTKPLDVAALIDVLDRFAGRKPEEAYRILIVDDSATLANFYKLTLEQAGMVGRVVTNPLEALAHLQEFNPDLVLMDMYMPECTGAELATVVRQFTVFLSIPIVFLSAEKNLERQQEAMSLGGDDFLTKPIQPDYLVSAVASRVQRARALRSIMYRDSLTGLLNHTESKKQLDIQLSRAIRSQMPLAVAMVDIDHFKSVNDTYGHPVGDRVIRSLSLLLQQRLRKSDIVGRYGGEEFIAILPDTPLEAAVKVMDEVREAFSKVEYQTPQGTFYASFSCGVAAYPDFAGLDRLLEQADQALYRAKKAGRNRVNSAGEPV
ncbi:diguanylate cyclase [Methylogaea oryzae]|uniref:diguanylate cyclase n=2 Tax=Methylogaea oryzae TaxID=1295382 RepID=A0A8D4VR46_9GAMM|nr:diguanylate cyclase [Methylogaea oryzae]BBL71732.1 hypothetical protein MoryE10_23380 [Methylogaea oryzae]